jgi:protein OS-9
VNKEGQRLPIPANFGQENQGRTVEIIAKANSKAEGGKVEMVSDAELQKLDLDPEMMDELKRQVEELAAERGGKGWKIEVVNQPGREMEIIGIVDDDGEEGEQEEDGSEEIFFKDEL